MSEFAFHTEFDLTVLLGRKATNCAELQEGMVDVPDSSIYRQKRPVLPSSWTETGRPTHTAADQV